MTQVLTPSFRRSRISFVQSVLCARQNPTENTKIPASKQTRTRPFGAQPRPQGRTQSLLRPRGFPKPGRKIALAPRRVGIGVLFCVDFASFGFKLRFCRFCCQPRPADSARWNVFFQSQRRISSAKVDSSQVLEVSPGEAEVRCWWGQVFYLHWHTCHKHQPKLPEIIHEPNPTFYILRNQALVLRLLRHKCRKYHLDLILSAYTHNYKTIWKLYVKNVNP